tara:strand:+ start:4660 stop:5082 length:423 start_codon:yes stop_codon:yes gene_type:complete
MNAFIFLIISIPVIEIYFLIKIGSEIGAFNTIGLIFLTAFLGIYYARYEGFRSLRSGLRQIISNELPLYEIISGAAIAFAALLLIIPGFITDIIGIFLIFPPTRKIIFKIFSKKYNQNNNKNNKNDFIEGEFEDIDEDKK